MMRTMEQHHVFESVRAREPLAVKPWEARHDVQFYDDDDYLASCIAAFIAEGVRCAQPAVVIATPAHIRAIQDHLTRLGVNVDAVRPHDMVWLDARDTLASFMEGGRCNPELFDATVGRVLETITASRRYVTVRAFGEMVDLLWRDQKPSVAIQLEELWAGLASRYSFALLCAYSKSSLDPKDMAGIDHICRVHNRVLPARPAA